MGALPQWPRTDRSKRRRGTETALVWATVLLAVSLPVVGCSSNSKPKSLPPQTIAPEPPDLGDPVSNQPQVGIEQLPTVPENAVASTTAPEQTEPPVKAPVGESRPAAPTVEPVEATASAPEEDDSITMVIESPTEAEAPQSTSLFDAAAAERERRAEAGESTIVLDDKTLKRYSKGSVTEPSAEESTDVAAPDTQIAAAEELAENESIDDLLEREQFWRNRVLDIRMDWRHSLDRIVELEEEVAGLRRDFYAEDDPFYRDSQIKPAWDNALDELADEKKAAERYQRDLDRVLEEGRREGALPGWLREGIELEPTEEELDEVLQREGEFHEPAEPVVIDDGRRR